MSLPKLNLILFLLLLAACSGSDPGDDFQGPGPDPDPDPDPQFDIDIVRFRVWTLEAGGVEHLRWIGTTEGPLPESPENTRWPWVGFARAFRVEWRAFSEDAPISGTQYRVSQSNFGPWLPRATSGASIWGTEDDFIFNNNITSDELLGQSCLEGPDCVGQLRFDSGRHRVQVKAITSDGREIDEDLGLLEFEVNYPPSVELVTDPATGPEDPVAAPVAWWSRTDGSVEHVALSPGDTIPSGAMVRFRLRGEDRFRSTTDTDSFCCDEQLDSAGSTVSFHAMTNFVRENFDGVRDSLFTLFGPTSGDSLLTMNVGPFDYGTVFRARDEHGRRGDTVGFDFIAGYPPRLPDTAIEEGTRSLLSPDRDPLPDEIPFVRGSQATMGWDSDLHDWLDDPDLTPRLQGIWYEIPLIFRGDPHPAVADVSPVPPPEASEASHGYSDHVRAFAYELVHENDPNNNLADGPGDRDDLFFSVDEIGELDLTGERTWRIFIPDLVFDQLDWFDPAGDCETDDFCEIGAKLLEQLGEFELRLRSKTTNHASEFHQEAPQARRDLTLDLDRHGRFSAWMSRTLSVRLVLTDDQGQITDVWPAETP